MIPKKGRLDFNSADVNRIMNFTERCVLFRMTTQNSLSVSYTYIPRRLLISNWDNTDLLNKIVGRQVSVQFA